eukprot:8799303-Heterocapsa_arctica.AAC.1
MTNKFPASPPSTSSRRHGRGSPTGRHRPPFRDLGDFASEVFASHLCSMPGTMTSINSKFNI